MVFPPNLWRSFGGAGRNRQIEMKLLQKKM